MAECFLGGGQGLKIAHGTATSAVTIDLTPYGFTTVPDVSLGEHFSGSYPTSRPNVSSITATSMQLSMGSVAGYAVSWIAVGI